MLDSLRGEILSPLIGLLIMAILAISVVGIFQWRKIRQAEMENALKQQMLERGMSANEIAQVISASPSKTPMNLPVV